MGKAAVDLPDPLQSPSDVGKPLTSTDDLLAQLAGEEIDRLLSEVDDQAGHAAAPPLRRSGPGPTVPIDLDGTPEPAAESPAPLPPEDEAAGKLAAAPDQPDVTAELDALFRSALEATPEAKAPTAAPAAPVPSRPPPHPRQLVPATARNAGVVEEPSETSADERAGLRVTLPGPSRSSTPGATAATPVAVADPVAARTAPAGDELPVYLKPLEWINAPLAKCPSALRDFIGKAAIITLVNAAAVFAYVMLFRKS